MNNLQSYKEMTAKPKSLIISSNIFSFISAERTISVQMIVFY